MFQNLKSTVRVAEFSFSFFDTFECSSRLVHLEASRTTGARDQRRPKSSCHSCSCRGALIVQS